MPSLRILKHQTTGDREACPELDSGSVSRGFGPVVRQRAGRPGEVALHLRWHRVEARK